MPTMKVTFGAAMRARDVSRPHAEHVAWAEAGASAGTPEGVAVETGVTADTEVVVEAAVTEGQGRAEARGRGDGAPRRRRVRSSSRRGRPSR
jgi:hypothetical protein